MQATLLWQGKYFPTVMTQNGKDKMIYRHTWYMESVGDKRETRKPGRAHVRERQTGERKEALLALLQEWNENDLEM